MKKSVILVISVIYILSIIIVGFVGMRLKISNPIIYVDKIICVSEGYEKFEEDSELYNEGYDGYIFRPYSDGLKVEIRCEIEPKNATNKKLEYITSDSKKYKLIVNSDGTATVEFYEKKTTAVVIIKATDNAGASIKIQIIAF